MVGISDKKVLYYWSLVSVWISFRHSRHIDNNITVVMVNDWKQDVGDKNNFTKKSLGHYRQDMCSMAVLQPMPTPKSQLTTLLFRLAKSCIYFLLVGT